MAKISTYTVAPAPISGEDKLIGTDASDSNITKNFTVNEIAQYVEDNITPGDGSQGPQGVQGPTGPQGPAGPVGPAGLNWMGNWVAGNSYNVNDAVGYSGASWFCISPTSSTTPPNVNTTSWALLASQGATGPAGSPGAQGPLGAQGPVGPAGPIGPAGTTGPAGPTGATGPAGPIGPNGPTGTQGALGPAGSQGVQGPIGPQGVAGPVGPAGLNWQGSWVSGTSYVADDAVGYGGASWFCILATSGTTTPDLDTTHWALLASQGAIGPAGPTGAQGPVGPQGPQGDPGPPGPGVLGWQLTGNSSTNPSVNFIGTTDAQDVIFKSNNIEYFRLKSTLGTDSVLIKQNVKIQAASDSQIFVDATSDYAYMYASGVGNPVIALGNTTISSEVQIGRNNITGNKNIELPNVNGTLVASVNGVVPNAAGNVTLSSSIPSLSQVTAVGNQTSSNIIINPGVPAGKFEVNSLGDGGGVARIGTSSLFHGYLLLGQQLTGISGILKANNLSASRTIDLPDTTGTLVASVNGVAPDTAGNVTIPSVGYKSYVIRLGWDGSTTWSAVDVYENTIGAITLNTVGGNTRMNLNSSGLFTLNKTVVMPCSINNATIMGVRDSSPFPSTVNDVYIKWVNVSTGGVVTPTTIGSAIVILEVRVYL
jgi:hypothetical protein